MPIKLSMLEINARRIQSKKNHLTTLLISNVSINLMFYKHTIQFLSFSFACVIFCSSFTHKYILNSSISISTETGLICLDGIFQPFLKFNRIKVHEKSNFAGDTRTIKMSLTSHPIDIL